MRIGIQAREDAARCLEHRTRGIVVSNHGGRADETLRGTIDCLPEVVEAVGIGRPYIWGLGSFGQPGVERVLDILNRESESRAASFHFMAVSRGLRVHAPSSERKLRTTNVKQGAACSRAQRIEQTNGGPIEEIPAP